MKRLQGKEVLGFKKKKKGGSTQKYDYDGMKRHFAERWLVQCVEQKHQSDDGKGR